jgi:hypothetical protein
VTQRHINNLDLSAVSRMALADDEERERTSGNIARKRGRVAMAKRRATALKATEEGGVISARQYLLFLKKTENNRASGDVCAANVYCASPRALRSRDALVGDIWHGAG